MQLVDVVTAWEDKLTLAIDTASASARMDQLDGTRTKTWATSRCGQLIPDTFPFKGIRLPMGYNTTMDFRGVTASKVYVDKYAVDEPIDDLAAPAMCDRRRFRRRLHRRCLKSRLLPKECGCFSRRAEDGGANSILFEFADHLTMFEAPSSQAWAKALMERARATVPGKPLTEVIVSHHHFDHTGGIRQAIAEGLTLIAHKGNEGLFREIAARKGTIGPDAIGANLKPLKFKAVDEHMELKDSAMEVHVYHAVSQSHMAEGVFAYVPRDKLLVQGDFFDVGWELYWWQNTYIDNIRHWNLQVDTDVPVHGRVYAFTAGPPGNRAHDQSSAGALRSHQSGRSIYARVSGQDACSIGSRRHTWLSSRRKHTNSPPRTGRPRISDTWGTSTTEDSFRLR